MKRRDFFSHGIYFRIGEKAGGFTPDIDVAGVWEWRFLPKPNIVTLELSFFKGQLTGTIRSTRAKITKIDQPTILAGVLTFSVSRKQKGAIVVVDYYGNFRGDTIVGTVRVHRSGHIRELAWFARRRE